MCIYSTRRVYGPISFFVGRGLRDKIDDACSHIRATLSCQKEILSVGLAHLCDRVWYGMYVRACAPVWE